MIGVIHMDTEQNQDATDYIDAVVSACQRRLKLLTDAYHCCMHTADEYNALCKVVILETEQAWGVSIADALYW